MPREHFIEVEATEKKTVQTYRFYGLGRWKIKDGRGWRSINAIFIPSRVLEVVASQCKPVPLVLSESQIAALCGGK